MKKIAEVFGGKWSKYANAQGSGGCDTCGYGAEELMSERDFKDLLAAIDKFIAEEFTKPER